MKKVNPIFIAFVVALFAISFSSCTQNNEDVYTPKIISMNFATSEEAYLQNDYLPRIARAGELYIGFELSDEDKDIKEIIVHADREYESGVFLNFTNHRVEIPPMDSATTSYGFYITDAVTGTFIFYAYVRDSYGNISETIKKTITLVPYAPEIISMEFAASEEDYKQGNYITSVNENEHFYIGFKIKDDNKDATQIYLKIKNSSETTTIPIDDMTSEIWTGGIAYTFLEAGEFTFNAYAVDSAEKTSSWMSKKITIISSKPEIISIKFADDEANYKLGKYISRIYKDTHKDASFYIGFTLFDNQKDITNIHFTINSSEEKIHSINMDNQTYSTGFTYTLSETGTFTISAYAEDVEGNYSKTIEKEFTVIPHTPKIKSSSFALSERNYLLGNYITKLSQDEKNTPLYLGLEVEDYGRDITKIDIVVKDYYDNELSNGSWTINVDSMSSETWTGGIDFSLSRFELLNWYYFHISVEDKDGNKTSRLTNSFQIDTTTIWSETIYLDHGKSITKSFTLDKATTLTIKTERVDDNGKLDSLSGGRGLKIYLRDAKGLLKSFNTVTGYLSTSIKCAAGTYECEIKDNFVIQHNNSYASKNVKVSLTKQD